MPNKHVGQQEGQDIRYFMPEIVASKRKFEQLAADKIFVAKTREIEATQLKKVSGEIRDYAEKLILFSEIIAPARIEKVQITLGRSDSIARYFTFQFANRPRIKMADLENGAFYGSGVYAIYYMGNFEPAYEKLKGTETPIYVGKADPKDPYAETAYAQGMSLHTRLKEHLKSLNKANLDISAFEFRYATIQSGLQASVEEYLIRLFLPIWNKEIKICFGLGKHGDSAKTRTNKRSPWDTMHPGREWAKDTLEDQNSRYIVEEKIREHLKQNPPFKNKAELLSHLA